MKLFDPKAYHLHTQRAKKTFHGHDFLFQHVGNELGSRLQDLKKTFFRVLNLSPHPLPCLKTEGEKSHENDVFLRNKSLALDCFTPLAMTILGERDTTATSLLLSSPVASLRGPKGCGNPWITTPSARPRDDNGGGTYKDHTHLEEHLPYPEAAFDLILSCLQLHWVNDLPGLLKSIHSSLENEGLFIGALWGGQTLFELRESLMQAELQLTGGASPRVSPMIHPADAPHLLSRAGFFLPVVDTETITVTYSTLRALLKDLRGMGETNKLYDRSKTFTSRTLFNKAEEIYLNSFGNPDGTLPATFEVVYLTGWKR